MVTKMPEFLKLVYFYLRIFVVKPWFTQVHFRLHESSKLLFKKRKQFKTKNFIGLFW